MQMTFTIKYRVSPELDERRKKLQSLLEESLRTRSDSLASPLPTVTERSQPTKRRYVRANEKHGSLPIEHNSASLGQLKDEEEESTSSESLRVMNMLLTGKYSQEESDAQLESNASNYEPNFDVNISNNMRTTNASDKRASGPSTSYSSPMLTCTKCGRSVTGYMNSLTLHVSTHHCESPIYECLQCGKKWFCMSARYKDHFAKHDSFDLSLLKDNRQQLMPFLKAKAMELFPTYRTRPSN